KYFLSSKLYLWKQHSAAPAPVVAKPAQPQTSPLVVPKLSQSKLKDLAWSLNIKDTSQGSAAPEGLAL
ncbi:MAG: hypothetical protein KGI70_03410, partial [Patescibacteria group bacterium]|nr:hypothetical protein [Patescibacteria group bacterium]